MSVDTFTTIPATIGGGFIGGLLLGYALKKVVKLIAVVVGLFIAGLVYLQHQQLAYFHWEKIKTTVTEIFGNVSSQILDQDITSFALSNLGIPLTSGMSAGFAVGFMKG
jgi:uncharacterized membrane protein (Fun14 family)